MVLGPHFNAFGSSEVENYPARGWHTDEIDVITDPFGSSGDENYPARGRHTDEIDVITDPFGLSGDENYPAGGRYTDEIDVITDPFGSSGVGKYPARGRHTDEIDVITDPFGSSGDENYPAEGRYTGLDYSYLDFNSRADLRGPNACMTGPSFLMHMTFTAGAWYFHYTSGPSLEAINRCGYIKQSLEDGSDAVAGKGVYLTKIPPYGIPKEQIAMQIYTPYHAEQKIREGKLDRCIGVWLKDSDVKYVHADGRDIFVYPEDLHFLKFNCWEFCL